MYEIIHQSDEPNLVIKPLSPSTVNSFAVVPRYVNGIQEKFKINARYENPDAHCKAPNVAQLVGNYKVTYTCGGYSITKADWTNKLVTPNTTQRTSSLEPWLVAEGCGSLKYSFTLTSIIPVGVDPNVAKNYFSLEVENWFLILVANPPLDAIPGQYQLRVTAKLAINELAIQSELLSFFVSVCSFNFQTKNQQVIIGATQPVTQTFLLTNVTQTPGDCRYTFKFSVSSTLPSFVTANQHLNQKNVTISAQTDDRSFLQNHRTTTVMVTAVANENANLAPVSKPYNLTLIDPCLTTVLQSTQRLLDMKISALRLQPETQQVLPVKDSVSKLNGDKSGFTFCPDRTYTVSSLPLLPAGVLSIDASGLLRVNARAIAHSFLGIYTITVKVAFSATQYINLTKFQLTIESCVVTGLSSSTSLNLPRSYTIGDAAKTWSFVQNFATMTPLCPYTLDYTFENLPNCVKKMNSMLTQALSVESLVRDDATDRQVIVTVAVQEQPDQFIVDQFRLEINDPCLTTVIGDQVVPELVAFQGYQTQSPNKLYLTDNVSVSIAQSNPILTDFCGPLSVSFKCNGTLTDVLSGQNFDLITFSPTMYTKPGLANCIMKVTMPQVANVVKTIGFTATTMGYVVAPIPDQVYYIGAQLLIKYSQFEIYPDMYFTTSDYRLYQVDDTGKLVSQFDLQELAPINDAYFTLDKDKRTIRIQIKDLDSPIPSFINVVLAAVVQDTIALWTNFKVTLIKIPLSAQNKAPIWQASFGNFQVNQCDSKPTVSWFFDLPGLQDIEGDDILEPVVIFQSQAISYDPINRRFKQQMNVSSPANVAVEIRVEDSRGATETHTFQIQLRCYFNKSLTQIELEQEPIFQQTSWPQATIERIDPIGKMIIRFDREMTVPAAASELQNATITLNNTLYPALNIRLVPGPYSSVEPHSVNWTFSNFTTSRLAIQLYFHQPALMSSVIGSKDLLLVTFFGYTWFKDHLGNFMMPGYQLNSRSLPMLSTIEEVQVARQIGSIAQLGASSLLSASTVINLLMAGPLQQILGTVNFSQILMHLLLIDVPIPATTSTFFSEFMSLLTWQLVDLTKYFDSIFKLDQVDALTDQFSLLGYQSLYIVQNLGTITITIVAPFVFWVVIYLFARFFYPKLKVRSQKLTKMLFFDKTLQFIDETYLILAICAALNLHYYRWNSWGNTSNLLMTFATLIVVVAFPIIVGVLYSTKGNLALIRDREQTGKSFMEKYGSLVRSLNTHRRGASVVSQLYVDKFRKLWLVYVLVFMQQSVYQSLLMVVCQALMMSIVVGHVKPHTEKHHTSMELFNEFTALLVVYHLTLFTDYVPQVEIREYIGKSLCIVICGNMAINLYSIFYKSLVLFYSKMQMRYAKWRQMQKYRQTQKQKWRQDQNKLKLQKLEKDIESHVAQQAQQELVQAELQLLSSISERSEEDSISERRVIAAKTASNHRISWNNHQQLKPESIETFERNQPTLLSYVPPSAAIVQLRKNQMQQVQSYSLQSAAYSNQNNRFVFEPKQVISDLSNPQTQQLEIPSLLNVVQKSQQDQDLKDQGLNRLTLESDRDKQKKDQTTQDFNIQKPFNGSLQEQLNAKRAKFEQIRQSSKEQYQSSKSQLNHSSMEPPAWHKQKKFQIQ